MTIKVGQTVHLMGGDSGTVEDIFKNVYGMAYKVNVDGHPTWVGEDVVQEVVLNHQNHPTCHYCGMPATNWGFFNEPVCNECRS